MTTHNANTKTQQNTHCSYTRNTCTRLTQLYNWLIQSYNNIINKRKPRTATRNRNRGVFILIHTELEQHITQIERVNNRIMYITLQNKTTQIPITILNTRMHHRGKVKRGKRTLATNKQYTRNTEETHNNPAHRCKWADRETKTARTNSAKNNR